MSLQGLADAIEGLEVGTDGASLKRLLWLRDRLDAKIVDVVIGFDRDCGWAFDGAGSLQAWLRTEGCSDRDANRVVDTVRKLAQLLEVHGAWRCGDLTGGQVDMIVYSATSKRLPVYATLDATIAETLTGADIADTKRALRHLGSMVDDLVDDGSDGDQGPAVRRNTVRLSQTLDGRWKLSGDLDSETGELLDTALRLAASNDPEPDLTVPERHGDAIGAVAGYFLDNHDRDDVPSPRAGQRRNRPHLHVMIHPDGTAETDNGIRVPGSSVERLLCDAKVNTVRFKDGHVLYYGREQRTASDAQYHALVVRDRHCRFPGCERRAAWCSAHHVTFWEHDGPTDIDNMVLLCAEHHRRLHDERGWRNKLLPDGTYEVTWPSGVTRSTRPPGDPDNRLF